MHFTSFDIKRPGWDGITNDFCKAFAKQLEDQIRETNLDFCLSAVETDIRFLPK